MSKIQTTCSNCGAVIYRTPYQYKIHENHYCSKKCEIEHRKKNAYEHRKCEICGKDMYVSKKSTQRFCSEKCQHEWQKTNIGLKNPRFTGEVLNCEVCGKEIYVNQPKLKRYKHHFCSDECRQKWYAEDWSQSLEWSAESSKRAVRILSEGRMKRESKPQQIVNNLLKEKGINFVNEKAYGRYAVDNYLIDYDLVIEVMGDYWHCSPVKYSTPINSVQRRSILRDRDKREYIETFFNTSILYLWEKDICNNIECCSALIDKFISNKGNLQNYNSFNYNYNENLMLNNNIILPYYELSIEECLLIS